MNYVQFYLRVVVSLSKSIIIDGKAIKVVDESGPDRIRIKGSGEYSKVKKRGYITQE